MLLRLSLALVGGLIALAGPAQAEVHRLCPSPELIVVEEDPRFGWRFVRTPPRTLSRTPMRADLPGGVTIREPRTTGDLVEAYEVASVDLEPTTSPQRRPVPGRGQPAQRGQSTQEERARPEPDDGQYEAAEFLYATTPWNLTGTLTQCVYRLDAPDRAASLVVHTRPRCTVGLSDGQNVYWRNADQVMPAEGSLAYCARSRLSCRLSCEGDEQTMTRPSR